MIPTLFKVISFESFSNKVLEYIGQYLAQLFNGNLKLSQGLIFHQIRDTTLQDFKDFSIRES